jgi:hypothetical protein
MQKINVFNEKFLSILKKIQIFHVKKNNDVIFDLKEKLPHTKKMGLDSNIKILITNLAF